MADHSELTNGTSTKIKAPAERWEIKLGLGQVSVLWGVMAGLMVMVFLFGLFAGREQGVNAALDSQGGQSIRLPVTNILTDTNPSLNVDQDGSTPVLTTDNKVVDPQFGQASNSKPAIEVPVPALTTVQKAADENPADLKFDFSSNSEEIKNTQQANADSKTIAQVREALIQPEKEIKQVAKAKLANQPVKTLENKNNDSSKSVKAKKEIVAKKAVNQKLITKVSKGWYVQVSAEASAAAANDVVNRLQSQGISSIVEETEIKGVVYFRVLCGPISNKTSAQNLREKIVDTRVPKGSPFIKFVN